MRVRAVARDVFTVGASAKQVSSAARTAAMTPINLCNCGCGVYGAVTLFAGDVVFDEVGMLQPG